MTETQIRLTVFLGVLIVMSALEALFPARDRVQTRTRRWGTNFGLVVIDTLAIRFLFPVIAVGAALWAQTKGWGLLNVMALPIWVKILFAVIAVSYTHLTLPTKA